jgi:hypothetical protein
MAVYAGEVNLSLEEAQLFSPRRFSGRRAQRKRGLRSR